MDRDRNLSTGRSTGSVPVVIGWQGSRPTFFGLHVQIPIRHRATVILRRIVRDVVLRVDGERDRHDGRWRLLRYGERDGAELHRLLGRGRRAQAIASGLNGSLGDALGQRGGGVLHGRPAVLGVRHGFVEGDVGDLQGIIGGGGLVEVERIGLGAAGGGGILGEAARRLRLDRRGPRFDPVLGRVVAGHGQAVVEAGGQRRVHQNLLRSDAGAGSQILKRRHGGVGAGEVLIRGRTDRRSPFPLVAAAALRRLGPRDQRGLERQRPGLLRALAGQWPEVAVVTRRPDGRFLGDIVGAYVGTFLGRGFFVGVPSAKVLGEGGLAAEAGALVSGHKHTATLELIRLTPSHIRDSRKCKVYYHCVCGDVSPDWTTAMGVSTTVTARGWASTVHLKSSSRSHRACNYAVSRLYGSGCVRSTHSVG